MANFFISYNAADAAKAEWIAFTLREAGFSVRYSKWELVPGQRIASRMNEALDDCDQMIAVCPPDYFALTAIY